MSRARNIKPGFFKNDVLAECDPLARILFAGLWCESDRAGRLEDRPKKIKAECLPYDECDIEALLGQLVSHGFILRYEASGVRYIQVIEFSKHQNPHKNEAISTIPAPCLHGTSTVQVPSPDGSAPADSSIPDSPSLIPDSLTGEIDAREPPTSAGEAAVAMRKAGCISINQSHPDFLAALDERVTAKEFGDAVTASAGAGIKGAGLFTYAVKVARTTHSKTATVVSLPSARAGPGGAQAPSKTRQSIQNLQDTANALIQQSTAALGHQGTEHWADEAANAQLGWSPAA
ncbi:hypothetical protein [Luteibacter sp.]|uniref:hypothetical protein n=1 Tax=Luteibacter sp. TaxID=1886636 RepID=UPI002F4212A2